MTESAIQKGEDAGDAYSVQRRDRQSKKRMNHRSQHTSSEQRLLRRGKQVCNSVNPERISMRVVFRLSVARGE